MKHLLCITLAIVPALISAGIVFAGDAANQPASPAMHYFPDFSKQANMGFRDDVAADGKGGWSDQGADNDFRGFDIDRKIFGGVPFRIINPAENNGRAILTFASPHVNSPLREVELRFKAPVNASWLYLLHTSCWNSKKPKDVQGTIVIHFADHTTTSLQIMNLRDISDWWKPGDLPNAAVVVERENRSATVGVYLSRFRIAPTPKPVASLTMKTAEKSVWIVVAATLSDREYKLPRKQPWTAAANEHWRPVDFSEIDVVPGSALDLSGLIDPGPAGRHGRIVLNQKGRMVLEKNPDREIRFFGCSMAPHRVMGKDFTHADIERYCRLLRMHGYNLLRPHFLDSFLMRDSREDLVFDPARLDQWEYLVYCLKKEGIYLYLDAMTSWSGYLKGSAWTSKAKSQNFKKRIFCDPAVREHYRLGVTRLLTRVNPYTRTRLADDPIVATILCFNEQNINLWKMEKGRDDPLYPAWKTWLRKRYGNNNELRKAWTDATGRCWLTKDCSLDNPPAPGPRHLWQFSPVARDVAWFFHDLHKDLMAWYVQTLRAIGYQGLITQWDWLPNFLSVLERNDSPVISMHGYHAHPSDYTRKGSTIIQTSSIARAGNYWSGLALNRMADRPFVITEYGHVFWNRYRYEEGLLYGAYSALQGYSGLMAHANPVMPIVNKPIYPFMVGRDPVALASQVVTAFAFLRGDVSHARHTVEVNLNSRWILDKGRFAKAISADQLKLALLTGTTIGFNDLTSPSGISRAEPELRLPVFGTSSVDAHAFFAEIVNSKKGTIDQLAATIARMRSRNWLAPSNRTDVRAGIFEADTGEILMQTRAKSLRVITPKLEGICGPAVNQGTTIGRMTVNSSNVPASITLVALDNSPISQSRRLLLVFATDALNTGMRFTTAARQQLLEIGKLPILMRTGSLNIVLELQHASSMTAWALSFAGTRTERLPITIDEHRLCLSIDTTKLKHGPTPYFEIAYDILPEAR